MKRCLIVCAFLRIVGETSAQTFEWANVKPIDLSTNPDFLQFTLTLDTAGCPVCTRLLHSKLSYNQVYYGDQSIEKLSGAGTSMFVDTLFGKVNIQCSSIDRNNNVFLAGLFRDTIRIDTTVRTIAFGSTPNCFILKLHPDGTLAWLKNMTLTNPTWSGLPSLKVDNAGNLWAAVQTNGSLTYVKKLDGDGNAITSFQQSGTRVISCLAVDVDGNVWVTGSTFNGPHSFNGLAVTAPFSYDMYVVRYSPSGVASWVRFVEDVTLQTPLIAALGNGAVMSGNLFDSTTFGQLGARGPQWVYDLFVTRLDTHGNFVWLSEIPPGNRQGDALIGRGPFVGTSGDGSISVAGFTRGSINWGNGIATQAHSYKDVLILSYSPEGDLRWAKTVGSSAWTNRGDAVALDIRGNTYLAGYVGPNAVFDSLQYSGGSVNGFLAKLCPNVATQVTDGEQPHSFVIEQNYPNPFNPTTSIGLRVSDLGFVSLKVFDILGREVATLVNEVKQPGTYTVQWDANTVASGVYLYRLASGRFTETKRMILMK